MINEQLKKIKILKGLIICLREDAERMGSPFLNQSFITELERQRAEILKRYDDGLKWYEVAECLFISRATAFRLHKQAIKELEKYDIDQGDDESR